MDIKQRLRSIMEGSVEIETSPLMETTVYTDELSLFTESMKTDFTFIAEMGMLTESSGDKNVFAKILDWIIQKINSIIEFVKGLFKKNGTNVGPLIKSAEAAVKEKGDIKTSLVGYKKLLDSPEESVNRFKDELVKMVDQIDVLIAMMKEGKLPDRLKDSKDSNDYSKYVFGSLRIWSKPVNDVKDFLSELFGEEGRVEINLKDDLKSISTLLTTYYKSEGEFTKSYENIKGSLEKLKKQITSGGVDVQAEQAERLKFGCMALTSVFHGVVLNMNIAIKAYENAVTQAVGQK